MRRRFLPGLLLGASAAGIAYACGASGLWIAVAGAWVAALAYVLTQPS